MFVAGGRKDALRKSAQTVDMKALHFKNGHVFGPQVNTKCALRFIIPKGDTDRFRLAWAWFGLVGSVPNNSGRYILLIQLYFKMDSRFFHAANLKISRTVIFSMARRSLRSRD